MNFGYTIVLNKEEFGIEGLELYSFLFFDNSLILSSGYRNLFAAIATAKTYNEMKYLEKFLGFTTQLTQAIVHLDDISHQQPNRQKAITRALTKMVENTDLTLLTGENND